MFSFSLGLKNCNIICTQKHDLGFFPEDYFSGLEAIFLKQCQGKRITISSFTTYTPTLQTNTWTVIKKINLLFNIIILLLNKSYHLIKLFPKCNLRFNPNVETGFSKALLAVFLIWKPLFHHSSILTNNKNISQKILDTMLQASVKMQICLR